MINQPQFIKSTLPISRECKRFTLIELPVVSPSTKLRTGWVEAKAFTLIELSVAKPIVLSHRNYTKAEAMSSLWPTPARAIMVAFILIELLVAKPVVAMRYIVAKAKTRVMRAMFTLIELLVAMPPIAATHKRGATGRANSIKFTLIELLVVIAIIAILASMLLPSLNKARATAKRALCKSNIKQIGFGAVGHINDHDGWIPIGYQNGGGQDWTVDYGFRALRRGGYMATELFECPSDNTRNSSTTAWASRNDDDHWYFYSWEQEWVPGTGWVGGNPGYLWNFALGYWDVTAQDFHAGSPKPYKAAQLKYPSRDLFCGDGETHRESVAYYAKAGKDYNWLPEQNITENWGRHINVLNFLFADGHVQSMPVGEFRTWRSDFAGRDF